jgi:ABC-type sugar transport system substrate-binding protein
MQRLYRRTALALIAAGAIALPLGSAFAQETVIGGMVFQQDQFFRGIQLGFEASAAENGITLVQGNSENKLEKEAELVDTFIARGSKAIVLAPLNADASVPALQRAADAGVTVVLYGTPLNAEFPVAYVGTSQYDLGKGTGESAVPFLKENFTGPINVGLVGFLSQNKQMTDDRTNGFLETVASGGVELNIVSRQEAWLAEQAVTVVTDMLTANPEIQVIYAANEGGTVGAVQAVRGAGLEGKVFVFGIDASEQLGNFLLDEDNVLIATTAQQPFEMGKTAMDVAAAAVKGETFDKTYDVPGLALTRADQAAVEAYLATVKQ